MSNQSIKALSIQILLFLNIFLSSHGLLGMHDIEEHKQTHPQTPLQTLTDALEQEKTNLSYSFFPPSEQQRLELHQRIESFVTRFMTLQGFTIPDQKTGPESKIALLEQRVLTQEETLKASSTAKLPSSATFSHYSRLFESNELPSFVADAAYLHFLEEWRHKIWHESPNFFPNFSLHRGLLVFCFHPQDLLVSRKFLSELFDILAILKSREKEAFIPQHQGLQHVFSQFQEKDKEKTMQGWGSPLLDETEKFYKEHIHTILWRHIGSALKLAKQEISNYLQLSLFPAIQRELYEGEYKRDIIACEIAEYLSSGIQFSDPAQARKDLLEWNSKLCEAPSSSISSMRPIYKYFGELLLIAYYQTRETSTPLPPSHPDSSISSLAPEYQIVLEEAYSNRDGIAQGVEGFSAFAAQDEEKLHSFIREVRTRILGRQVLQMDPLPQDMLEQLSFSEKITYLSLHERATLSKSAAEIFKLKLRKAALRLNFLQKHIHLKLYREEIKALEREGKRHEKEKLQRIERSIIQTLDQIKQENIQIEQAIKQLKEHANTQSTLYKKDITYLKILQHVENLAALQKTDPSLSPLEELQARILRTVQQKTETFRSLPPSEIEAIIEREKKSISLSIFKIVEEARRLFIQGRKEIIESLDAILLQIQQIKSSSLTPAGFSVIEKATQQYRRTVSETNLNPNIIALVEILIPLQQDVLEYSLLYKQPLTFVSKMFAHLRHRNMSQIKTSSSSLRSPSPGVRALGFLRKIMQEENPSIIQIFEANLQAYGDLQKAVTRRTLETY